MLSSFFIIAIKDILDLSATFTLSIYKIDVRRLRFQEGTHPIAPTALLLDLMFPPLFSMDLAPHFVLGLAVPGRGPLLVVVDGVIQSIPELTETRKCRHDGDRSREAEGDWGGF